MKKMIVLSLVGLVTIGSVFAQQEQSVQKPQVQKSKQCKQVKPDPSEQAEIYVKEFELEGEQAEQFKNIFMDYKKALKSVRDQFPMQRPVEGQQPTEEESEKFVQQHFAKSRAVLDTKERYFADFGKLLKPSQVARLLLDEKGPHGMPGRGPQFNGHNCDKDQVGQSDAAQKGEKSAKVAKKK